MSAAQEAFEAIGRSITASEEGRLFGKPCFKLGGKAFVCFFEDCMVFKLSGTAHRDALALPGAKLFDPSGKHRPMKEWVQLAARHQGAWKTFAQAAAAYVGEG